MAAQEQRMKTQVKHDDWLLEKLQDAEFAAEFLNVAGEDDDTKTYLTALRKVVDARGGIASRDTVSDSIQQWESDNQDVECSVEGDGSQVWCLCPLRPGFLRFRHH
jgi:hypothetical protein